MAGFKKSEVLKALDAAFRAEFNGGLKHIDPQWRALAMPISSNTKVNTYGFMSAFPKLVEWTSKRTIKEMQAQGISLENKKYEATVSVPRTDVEDDQVGLFRPMMAQMGQAAAELPDELVFGLLKAGESTLCYDGQNFFDTDHPYYQNVDGTSSGTNQVNLTTGSDSGEKSWYLMDTTNVIKPLIFQERTKPEFEAKFDPSKSDTVFMEDKYLWGARYRCTAGFAFWQLAHKVKETRLNAENVMKIIEIMTTLKADGGAFLNIRPNVLLVPPSLEKAALDICNADVINGTTNTLKGRLKVMVSPYIIE
ncbi:head protein [Pasteurellaceae bacterium HPA106]|uniref:Mu-like prophage major head subunit gpT family protein n=1 Tax=Spirabiliibacterium pneumoniae TaxID=221400 RepID=UPI001AAE13C7|nr:Mu-like prophage major head subunit gpT family protein [Spirabiliibacterium pneumoniae]MBE2895461.1 head protein [Spirabiliibacterium pneumoniae]